MSKHDPVPHPLSQDGYVPYTPRHRPSTKLATLKAAAQSIRLDPASVGWAMLEKIALDGDAHEWSETSHALSKPGATLLLPAEPASVPVTPELVHDHIVFRHNSQLVTLSGLRAHIVGDTITFRSTLPKPFPSLDALPPLPALPLDSSYPACTVFPLRAAVPLPSRPTKPPLPPRPTVRPQASSARLAMPFASLFGQRPSTPPPLPPTQSTDGENTVDIAALVIDTVLSRSDIATAITTALSGEIAVALNDQPPWLVERVHAFSTPYFPFVKAPAGKKKLQDIGGNPNRVVYAVNVALDHPDQLAHKFQSFYREVENELRSSNSHTQEDAPDDHSEADEAHIRNVLETVESTLCTLLYDRLFLPSTSDDASHNEALSSRITALNMLDLGLEHLDIDIGNANKEELDEVVRTCGQVLAQLDAVARSPREKAAVLVSVHKLVVEGLSSIPPIRLKSNDEADKDPTSQVSEHASILENKSPSAPTIHLSVSPERPSVIQPPSVETVPPQTSSPVSGDVLLPTLIFSVVKANPQRLVSHLLFTQRFRNQSFGGEESYCLINLMAVAEFLENVDLGALGLGDSENKVISTADLTPIQIVRPSPSSGLPIASSLPNDEFSASLRGRVEQGVDVIAGSANKVISGVVDSSFGVLRALLPGQTIQRVHTGGNGALALSATSASGMGTGGSAGETEAASRNVRPGLGLLRRETAFSIAGLTAALPGGNAKIKGKNEEEEGQRELVEVSLRSPSLRSHRSARAVDKNGSESEGEASEEDDEDSGEEDGEQEDDVKEEEGVHDTRSIKSFESMLSSGRRRSKTDTLASSSSKRRKRLTDLTDRLAHGMAGVSRRVQSGDSRASALSGRLPSPNRRFMECTEQDIRVSEVGELLREYQRLVEAVRSAGGSQD